MHCAWPKDILFSVHDALTSWVFNFFFLKFDSLDKARLVLRGGHWSYDNCHMVTLLMQHVDRISIVTFSHVDF